MDDDNQVILNQQFSVLTYIDDTQIKLANKLDINKNDKCKMNLDTTCKDVMFAKLTHITESNYKDCGFFDTCKEAIKHIDSFDYKIRNNFDKYEDAIKYANNFNYKIHGCFDTYEEAVAHANESRKSNDEYDFFVAEICE